MPWEIQNIKFVEEPVLKRKRKEPKYSLLHYLEGYESRSEAHHPTTPRDHYRKQLYQVIDVLISSVRDRLDQASFLAVNPASSATAKRTFSLARGVKTWMRSTMLPTRFNSVSILNFYKDRTDKLDLIKIANAFVQSDDNRMRIFGKFTKDDL